MTYPETRTDQAGAFSLAVDSEALSAQNWIVATATGLGLAWAELQAARPVTLRLTASPVTCSGLVTDTAGKPLSGATVGVQIIFLAEGRGRARWFGYLFLPSGAPLLQSTADAAGHFSLPDLPAGSTVELSAAAPGFAPAYGSHEEDANATDATVTLAPEATIAGRVTRAGQPLPGVRVETASGAPGHRSIVTAADGTYLLTGLVAGHWRVELRDLPDGWTAPALTGLVVAPGQHLTGCDLSLTPGAIITGTVRSAATHQPLAGIPVVASGPAEAHPQAADAALTDASGVYHLRVAAGHNWVYYLAKSWNDYDFAPAPACREVILQEGETRSGLDFTLAPSPRITGRAVLADGKPAAGVQLGGENFMFIAPGDPEATGEAVSDAEGHFALPPAPIMAPSLRWETGLGRLLAVDPQRGLAALTFVEDAKPITLAMKLGGWLVDQVVDLSGHPLPNLPVEYLLDYVTDHPGSSVVTTVTDKTGRVRLGPLPAGITVHVTPAGETALQAPPGELPVVRVKGEKPAKPTPPGTPPPPAQAIADNPWLKMGVFKLSPGEVRVLPTLHLSLNAKTYSVQGLVVDTAGHPVAGALVGCAESRQAATTDAAGHFTLTGLASTQPVEALALSPTERLAGVGQLTPDQSSPQRLTLQPMATVTGQLRDLQGRPQAESAVMIDAYDPLPRGLPPGLERRLGGRYGRDRAPTDLQGNFRYDHLVAGVTYCVWGVRPAEYEDPGPPPGPGTWQINRTGFWQAEITPQPGQTVDMTQYCAQLWELSGQVVDSGGRPVPDAQVKADNIQDTVTPPASAPRVATGWMPGTTDPAGHFAMGLIPRGASFELTVEAPGYASRSLTVTVTANMVHLGITLVPAASIAGRVLRNGKPVAGVVVVAKMTSGGCTSASGCIGCGCGCDSSGGGCSAQAVTGADGSYLLSALAAGTFRLSLAKCPEGTSAKPLEGNTLKAGEHLSGCDFALATSPRIVQKGG
jgi:hypothetical protein